MKFGEIKNCDIANGLGVRVSLFVSGCTHHCEGCFNQVSWDFDYGEEFTDEVQEHILEWMRPSFIAGLTLLGGEPMEPSNQKALLPFLKKVKARYPKKNIWLYSGYLFERDILGTSRIHSPTTDELIALIDVLVDGEFVLEKKDIALKFRGSSNQRIVDVKESLKRGETVLVESLMKDSL